MLTFGIVMKYLFLGLALYFLFRFIVRFVIPVARVTRMASSRMREMQDQMNQMQQQANNPNPAPKPKPVDGEYIDYEEVK